MASEAARKSTETLLHSVLISSPGGVPLHNLGKEYKSVTMSDIPLAKLGFSSIEEYIRSIPHCAFISTNKDGIIVAKGIATAETIRVAKLVSGQKKPKKKAASRFGKSRGGLLGSRTLQITRQTPKGGFPFRQPAPRSFSFGSRHIGVQSSGRPAQRPFMFNPNCAATPQMFPRPNRFSNPSVPKFASQTSFKPSSSFVKSSSDPKATNYVLPPRMRKLQQEPNAQENKQGFERKHSSDTSKGFSHTSPLTEVDVNQLKQDDLRFTITNNRQGSRGSFEERCQVLKSNVVKILESYPNGLWGDLFKKFYKDKFGEAPENILEIVKESMLDRVDIRSVHQGKSIIYLKKQPDPIPISPAVQEEPRKIEFAERNNDRNIPGDLRVVISRNSKTPEGSTREVVKLSGDEIAPARHTTRIVRLPEEEIVPIPQQDVPGIGEAIEAYICHIDGISRFFIHRADSEILEFSEKIQTYYQSSSRREDMLTNPKIGTWCCACYEGQWYRGKVILVKKRDNEQQYYHPPKTRSLSEGDSEENDTFECKILYVDYGNLESVHSKQMRKLKSEFSSLPAQAIQCKLHGVTLEKADLSEEAKLYFKEKTGDKLLKIAIKAEKDNIIDVELFTVEGESIAEDLIEQGFAVFEGKKRSPVKVDLSSPVETAEESEDDSLIPSAKSSILKRLTSLSLDDEEDIEVVNVELPEGKYLDVLVSAVNSFNEISVILLGSEYRGRLIILHEAMELFYENEQHEELESIDPDEVYAAYYEETWHRARVLDVKNDEVEIDLVDRGDQNTIKFTDLRKLPAQFKRLPLQAISLMLAHLTESEDQDYIQELSDMVLGKSCVAEVVDGPPEVTTIELYDTTGENDININSEIISKFNLCKEQNYDQVRPKVGEQGDAYVAHISDAGVFFVIFPGPGVQKLDELIDELTNYFAKGSKAAGFVQKPETDKICCTKWEEDDQMYRILITCVMPEEKKAEIEFIDYGNRDVVPFRSLREIPENVKDLLTLPRQVVKCELVDNREEIKPMWKYGLSSQMAAELKTQTVVVKVIDEGTADKLTTVTIYKTDSAEGTALVSVVDEIADICGPVRKRKSNSFTSSGSDTSASEKEQRTEETAIEREACSTPSGIPPSSNSQLSLASMDSDGPAERGKGQNLLTSHGLFLKDATVPDLQIKESWVNAHITFTQSPSKFYFQLQDYTGQLIDLLKAMNEYYKDTEDCFEDCCPGDTCAVFVPDDDIWYRCVVHSRVEIEDQVQVCVFFVDFGDLIFVPITEVRSLDPQFHSLPFQAVQASFTDIMPVGHQRWHKKAQNRFSELVTGKLFRAQIHGPHTSFPVMHSFPAEKPLSISLFDTSDATTDFCINESLVAENLAARQK